jgi:cysteine desulfuration protein SufE
VPPKLAELVEELGQADRRERIELLIDLARDLPPLPEHLAEFKDEAHRVPECQSPVFLFAECRDGRVSLHADAPIEAPTVRGFVALLVEGLDGATPTEVQSVPNDLIPRAGLDEVLGMQRVGGLHAVLRRLKAMTARAASCAPAADPV